LDIDLTIVIPARNESESLGALLDEILAVLRTLPCEAEIIVVDDGSQDETREIIARFASSHPCIRGLQLFAGASPRGRGQSAAFLAGFRASRGRFIATMDADRQNDPADLPAMLERIEGGNAGLLQGDRSANRRDTLVRRVSSRVGRAARRILLGDVVVDTGCSLRVMTRELATALPLHYRGMHRFIPFLAAHLGFEVAQCPVHHRPRVAGRSKYGIGNRAIPGLLDCLALKWLTRRPQPLSARALASPAVDAHAMQATRRPDEACAGQNAEDREAPK